MENKNKFNIIYRLLKYEMRNENQRTIKGWVVNNEFQTTPMKNGSKIFSRKELEELFSKEDIDKLESNTHSSLILKHYCEELDEILNWILSHKRLEHFSEEENKWNIVYNSKHNLVMHLYRGERFEAKLFIDDKEIYSDWGSDSSVTTLNVICDKVRRLYNYDDPYKHHVEDVIILDLIINKLSNKSEEAE